VANETNTETENLGPNPEDLAEYRRLIRKVREEREAGAEDPPSAKELADFVKRSGFANEAPPYDFPELMADDKP
jgi:hypothetical protein